MKKSGNKRRERASQDRRSKTVKSDPRKSAPTRVAAARDGEHGKAERRGNERREEAPRQAAAKADAPMEPLTNAQRRGKPAGTRSELEAKLARVRHMLEEMKDYKRILAESGLRPDEQDKIKESGLIKNLLSLEKQLGIDSKKQKFDGKGGGKRAKFGKGKPSSGAKGKKPAGGTGKPKQALGGGARKSPRGRG